jgi:retron-type reverse transcriptase
VFVLTEPSPEDTEYVQRAREHLAESCGNDVAQQAADYATTLIERGLPVLFDLGHLALVTSVPPHVIASMGANRAPHYTVFRIEKRSGGSREISAPRPALKHVQTWVARQILAQMSPHLACHGFVRGRSIVTNAEPHVGAALVFKLDIKDFFPSVPAFEIYRVFRRAGYSKQVARLLTSLTTFRGLPQGAPTSPALANLVGLGLDARLAGLARARGLEYTRYADDLTFSGEAVQEARVKRLIGRIVRDSGFTPQERKARYLHRGNRQQVTGIVVNEKINWPRWRRRWLRQEIHYLHRFGLDQHLTRRGISRSRYKEFIYGHVYALHATRPDEALPLLERLRQVEWPY